MNRNLIFVGLKIAEVIGVILSLATIVYGPYLTGLYIIARKPPEVFMEYLSLWWIGLCIFIIIGLIVVLIKFWCRHIFYSISNWIDFNWKLTDKIMKKMEKK